jgi:hypothetical protein
LPLFGGTAVKAQKKTITVGPRVDLIVAPCGRRQPGRCHEPHRHADRRLGVDGPEREVSIQPEFVLSGKGSKWPDDDASIKISYLQIPVLAQYRLTTGKTVNPYLLAGPRALVQGRLQPAGRGQ